VHDEAAVLEQRWLVRVTVSISELTADSLGDFFGLSLNIFGSVLNVECGINWVGDHIRN